MCTKVGLSADETQALISKTKDQEIKDTLKETTQKALDLGVSTLTKSVGLCGYKQDDFNWFCPMNRYVNWLP